MEQGELRIITKHRSSVDSEMETTSNMVHACGLLANANVQFSGKYPAWQSNLKSPLLQTAKVVYQDLFNEEPKIKTMHAGLECGMLSNKFPEIEVLSLGAVIQNAHSPDERVQISSVLKFWSFLRSLLQKIAAQGTL